MNNVINLSDYSKNYNRVNIDYKFKSAVATNSRLMGVIGIRVHFVCEEEELILFFHLDFEEYGLDRFEVYKNLKDVDRITKSVMGGLGAKLVPISLENVSTLIYSAVDVGDNNLMGVPIEFLEYEYLLEEFCEDINISVLENVSTEIRSNEELINYYIMRTIGCDYDARDMLLSVNELKYSLVDEPSVLLKNEILKEENGIYITKSIVDYLDAYKMIISEITIENKKVVDCVKIDELTMTAREAAFSLNKKEYIIVFYVQSSTEFKMFLENKKLELLKNVYNSGTLYTEFQKTNNHVNSNTYFLNGDIFGTYFMTDKNDLVISSFVEKDIIRIKEEFLSSFSQMNEVAKMEAENPILYTFVNSGYQNFFDFLGE